MSRRKSPARPRHAPRQNVEGTIYLLHLDPPVAHARHYLGWTERDVVDRLAEHLRGAGSPLVRAAVERGSRVSLVRTWPARTRHEERRLKRNSHIPRLCPACRAAALARAAAGMRETRSRKARAG